MSGPGSPEGLVSVVMPVHDAERYLAEAIDSVRAQRYERWELILVDDASVTALRDLGGLSAIAISHPHFYACMATWSMAFDDCPIYVHAEDTEWVQYLSPGLQLWQGETREILP